MEQARPAPRPIGVTELVAAVVAVLFAATAGGWLLADLAGARQAAFSPALAEDGPGAASPACAGAPLAPVPMRLGLQRSYAPDGITLDPAPFTVTPGLDGDQAYRLGGLNLAGCDTEEVLAYYSSSAPAYNRVLAWIFITTTSCPPVVGGRAPQRPCLSMNVLSATNAVLLDSRTLAPPR